MSLRCARPVKKSSRPVFAERLYKKCERGIVEAPALRTAARFGLGRRWLPSGARSLRRPAPESIRSGPATGGAA